MKTSIAFLAGLLVSGAAFAGSQGAGPAGTGSTTTGSVVSPQAPVNSDTRTGRIVRPGVTGAVVLTAAQSNALATALTAIPGSVTSEGSVTAPTTFKDGTAGTIKLDTRTGGLTLQRQ